MLFAGMAIGVNGCSSPADKLEDVRRSAQEQYDSAATDFAARNYSAAGQKFNAALTIGGLNPDLYCDATVKRAVCWVATGKTTEAIGELDRLEPGAPNLDQIYAARSYALAKQGKAAESRAALAKARQFNRTVQEFKD
ncbi:hypothetical protein [Lacipirellula parvula]|nr:hypothetical protein [Lacipirellula parvula]